jgi:hypothetical protein
MALSTVTRTSETALAMYYLAKQLANCSTFQSLVDADDATEAEAYIFEGETPNEDAEGEGATRATWALIGITSATRSRESVETYVPSGQLFILIDTPVPTFEQEGANQYGDPYVWFENVLSGIEDELWTQSGQAGRIEIKQTMREQMARGPKSARAGSGDWLQGEIEVTY